MLRAFSLVFLMSFAGPAFAEEATIRSDDAATLAQQQTTPIPPTRRGCEKNNDGIS